MARTSAVLLAGVPKHLAVEWSDGLLTTERFSHGAAFQSRVVMLEQQLLAEEWKQAGDSPALISGDWWKP
jgi:hypothetical protein